MESLKTERSSTFILFYTVVDNKHTDWSNEKILFSTSNGHGCALKSALWCHSLCHSCVPKCCIEIWRNSCGPGMSERCVFHGTLQKIYILVHT